MPRGFLLGPGGVEMPGQDVVPLTPGEVEVCELLVTFLTSKGVREAAEACRFDLDAVSSLLDGCDVVGRLADDEITEPMDFKVLIQRIAEQLHSSGVDVSELLAGVRSIIRPVIQELVELIWEHTVYGAITRKFGAEVAQIINCAAMQLDLLGERDDPVEVTRGWIFATAVAQFDELSVDPSEVLDFARRVAGSVEADDEDSWLDTALGEGPDRSIEARCNRNLA